MTRRERLEAKLAKRLDWAAKREKKSDAAFDATRKLADSIPLGQPILVGHHSERHARRDAERIHSGMEAGVEHAKMADLHASKAGGIEHALETSIFSDDADAIERLEERIDAMEKDRARFKLVNTLYRKGDAAGLAAIGISLDALARALEGVPSFNRKPHPPYELSNLGSNIRRLRERVVAIRARNARTAKAEASGGATIEGAEYVRVTFAEKPERSTIDALRAAGFAWSAGSWMGRRAQLPAGILPVVEGTGTKNEEGSNDAE